MTCPMCSLDGSLMPFSSARTLTVVPNLAAMPLSVSPPLDLVRGRLLGARGRLRRGSGRHQRRAGLDGRRGRRGGRRGRFRGRWRRAGRGRGLGHRRRRRGRADRDDDAGLGATAGRHGVAMRTAPKATPRRPMSTPWLAIGLDVSDGMDGMDKARRPWSRTSGVVRAIGRRSSTG